jgi:ribosomal protein L40E
MTSHDLVTAAVILLLVGLGVATFLELKFMRKNLKARRIRAAKRTDDLPDEAHNALLTMRAIATALERGGVRSDEVEGMLHEAQIAHDRRNYRVVMELTSKAKEKLTALKARHSADGDLAKVATIPAGGEEPTTKERLQKDFPPNLTQAKFTLELAESTIAQGRETGRDVAQAEAILVHARTQFDGKDYTAALVSARQAHRSALGEAIAWSTAAVPPASAAASGPAPIAVQAGACASCGTPLAADDLFCRKCGARAGPRPCQNCGATIASDDTFCRKCGTKVTR